MSETRVRTLSWVRDATDVSSCKSAEAAMKKADLDWGVKLEPVFWNNDGNVTRIPDRFAVIKDTDDPMALGTVGKAYKTFANREAFDFLDTLLGKEMNLHFAGSRKDGKTVYLAARLAELDLLTAANQLEWYLILRTSHDGTSAITVNLMPVRIQCTNGMCLTMPGMESKWAVRHVSDVHARMYEAEHTLELTSKYREVYAMKAEQMMAKALVPLELENAVKAAIPDTREKFQNEAVTGILSMLERSDTIPDDERNTVWGALCATTEWFDHVRGGRTANAAMYHQLDGDGARVRNTVANLLMEEAV